MLCDFYVIGFITLCINTTFDLIRSHCAHSPVSNRFVRALQVCNFLCVATFSATQLSVTLNYARIIVLNHLVRC